MVIGTKPAVCAECQWLGRAEMSCKRAQSRTCSGYAERSRHYANVVQASAEPNLFGLCRAQPILCKAQVLPIAPGNARGNVRRD